MLTSVCVFGAGLLIGAALVIRNNRKDIDAALAKYPELKRDVESAIGKIKAGLK